MLAEALKLNTTGVVFSLKQDIEVWDSITPIAEEDIEENHKRLLEKLESDEGVKEYIFRKRGFTLETVKKFRLGWGEGRNIAIPIYNAAGECMNLKLKSDPTTPVPSKGMFSIEGRGSKRIFNEKVLTAKTKKDTERVIICEGEWDCMLLDQFGYPAVTSTGGAMSFDESWIPAFSNFDKIYVCLDHDKNEVGQKGTKKIAELFLKHGIRVFLVELPPPFAVESKIDVTDFFVKRKSTKADFTQLLKEATEYSGGDIRTEDFRIIDFSTLMDRSHDEQGWIVDNIVPRKGLVAFAGLPGSFKSYFSLYIASCVAGKKQVLDTFNTQQVPILFIDKENPEREFQTRVKALNIDPSLYKDNLFYWDALNRGEFSIENEHSIEAAEMWIQSHKIGLTIIDSMIRIHAKSENDASDMNRVYQALRRLQNAGSAVLFIHHFNKGGSGMFKVTDVKDLLRGSGDILGWLDTYYGFREVEHGLLRIECGKNRFEKKPLPFLVETQFFEEETTFNWMGWVKEDDQYRQVAVSELLKHSLAGGISSKRGELLEKLSSRVSRATIDRTISQMKKLGSIITVQNGRDTLYKLSEQTERELMREKLNEF
jgi:hypothetical protein